MQTKNELTTNPEKDNNPYEANPIYKEAKGIKYINLDGAPHSTALIDWYFYWGFFIRHHFGGKCADAMIEKAQDRVRLISKSLPVHQTRPVPEYSADKMTPEIFKSIFIKHHTPVVLRGLAREFSCVKKWTPDFFSKEYGQEKVRVRIAASHKSLKGHEVVQMPMSELCEDIKNDGEMQGAALEDIIVQHKELKEDLQTYRLHPYSGRILATQIYMSGSKAKSSMHCAPGGNLFVQVYGSKKWSFVNPRHTLWMQAIRSRDMISSLSYADAILSNEENDSTGYDLFKYVPRFQVDLQPGDVLFSPQWWWHQVNNNSPSIGVACRFFCNILAGNPGYSFVSFTDWPAMQLNASAIFRGHGADAILSQKLFIPVDK